MIQCILCDRLVMNETKNGFLEDDALNDFHCPNLITLGRPPHQESHYHRVTCQGCLPEYTILIPPFYMIWLEGRKNLKIYSDFGKNYDPQMCWKYFDKIEFEEVVHWTKRLKVLVPFS